MISPLYPLIFPHGSQYIHPISHTKTLPRTKTPCMWHKPELSPNQPGERRHTIDPGQTYKYSAYTYIKGVEYMIPIRNI